MNGFLTGFNHATASGPLCEEPMQGACFIVHNVDLLEGDETQDTYGPFGG
jgi:translation elongation factor EF-G